MTIYRATVVDTPDDPFSGGELRAESDGALVVADGGIVARGAFRTVRRDHPNDEVVTLDGGILLPGLVDTHVHYPQVRVIGALGMPLLDWLRECALPEEGRLADRHYAASVAADFLDSLVASGTTTALVFGSHFAAAVDTLFTAAARMGMRITAGLVVSDTLLPGELLTDPERAYDEGRSLAERWHGTGLLRYAVTPRFSLSSTTELLDSCAALVKDLDGVWFTSHINENPDEVAAVAELHGCGYLETYDQHGLVTPTSVLAHNVHATDAELELLAAQDAAIAHCPSSNAALGSGSFPFRRHLEHGVRVALGCDVGAGTGFSILKEGLQAYLVQRLLGPDGVDLDGTRLLHLATSAGAAALGLDDLVGDLSIGKRFDAIWVRPAERSTLGIALRHAGGPEDALAKVFTLGTPADIAAVWVDGRPVVPGGPVG